MAQQSITIRNTGTTAITIPVGTLAATATGTQFQVVQSTGANASWTAGSTGDGTLGAYTIAAGSSLTLTVEALAQGYVGNVAANAITTLPGIAGASITASVRHPARHRIRQRHRHADQHRQRLRPSLARARC